MKSRALPDFMSHPWPVPENIVAPWLQTSGLNMLFGTRGGGKTFVTLGLALHVAAGWPFLEGAVTKPWRVLYVDGEMQAASIVKRISKLSRGMGPFPPCVDTNFRYLTHEDFERGIPSLSGEFAAVGRKLVKDESAASDLIILDNMSCLLRGGIENEAEGWKEFMNWVLSFRREAQTVILIHHAGKTHSAGSRGSSAKEDILDTEVSLETKDAGEEGDPIEIEWKFTKHRHFQPGKPFGVRIVFGREAGVETSATIRRCHSMQEEVDECRRFQEAGLTQREIAEQTGCSTSTVNRRLKHPKKIASPFP